MVAERIAGKKPMVNYDCVPVGDLHASRNRLGRQEPNRQLKASGEAYNVGIFPFAANGRALAADEAQRHGQGAGRCGDGPRSRRPHPRAAGSELIAQAVIAMEFGASAEDLGIDDVRASDPVRGVARSRARRGRARDPHDQSQERTT